MIKRTAQKQNEKFGVLYTIYFLLFISQQFAVLYEWQRQTTGVWLYWGSLNIWEQFLWEFP